MPDAPVIPMSEAADFLDQITDPTKRLKEEEIFYPAFVETALTHIGIVMKSPDLETILENRLLIANLYDEALKRRLSLLPVVAIVQGDDDKKDVKVGLTKIIEGYEALEGMLNIALKYIDACTKEAS